MAFSSLVIQITIFLHPQLPPQSDLHLQNIIVKQYNIIIKQKLPRQRDIGCF
jgi:hypothetical protein